MICIPLGAYLAKILPVSIPIIIGGTIISVAAFSTSFVQSFGTFLFTYSSLFGIGIGFGYMAPLISGWSYFPDRKGFVSGVIISGFGFGAFVFSYITQAYVNPDNLSPTIVVKNGNVTDHFFTDEVANRVPGMFRLLALLWAILTVIAVILVRRNDERKSSENENMIIQPLHPEVVSEEENPGFRKDYDSVLSDELSVCSVKIKAKQDSAGSNSTECPSFKAGLFTLQFWHLFAMFFLSVFYGIFLVNVTKSFGNSNVTNNDSFLTTVGALGSVANGVSRFIWAFLQDKLGFKKVYMVLLVLQLILTSTIYFIATVPGLYLVWVMLSLSCEGGNFSMFPTVTSATYGLKVGPQLYSIIFSANGLSSITGALLVKFVLADIGFEAFFWITALFTLEALVLLFVYTDTKYVRTQKRTESIMDSHNNVF